MKTRSLIRSGVSSQTVVCQNAQDKAFIAPYLNSARMMLQEISEKEQAKDEMKKKKKEKLRKTSEFNRSDILKSATKRTSDNTGYDNDGGKSQPLSTDDHFTTSSKKRKRDIECLSLTVSSSDLDDYNTSDDESSFVIDESFNGSDAITIGSSDNDDIHSDTSNGPSICSDYSSSNKNNCSSSSSSSVSSNSSQESVVLPKKKPKQTSNKAKIFSDYKENNKNRKKVIDIDIDSESDDEETDDGSEAHVVCFICGKYNTKKKFYLWISCTVCKNWFHKDCTHLWKINIKDIKKDNFTCRYH